MKRKIMAAVGIALIFLDQIFKYLAVRFLADSSPYVLIKNVLQLHYSENTGASFGMFSGRSLYLCLFNLLVLSIISFFIFGKKVKSKFLEFNLLMIVAGGFGNVIDRIVRRYVVDYIEPLFVNFAIFNFADCLITVGSILILAYLIADLKKDSGKRANEKEQAVNK